MADTVHIEDTLRGFYPNSVKVNDYYLKEMFEAFDFLSEDDFDSALKKHRSGPKAAFPPLASELSMGLGKVRYSSSNCAGYLMRGVIDYGWDKAVGRGMDYGLGYDPGTNEAIRSWMITCGITTGERALLSFTYDQQVYVGHIHGGDIVAAFELLGERGPEKSRGSSKKAAEFFRLIGNDSAKKYFHYHRMVH